MTDTMTREERIKYCQCCIKRRNSSSSGLICSLTGAQATFEGGCDKFEEDPIAMKEHFYVREEKKNSRYASIESLIVGLAICCFVIPYTVSVVGVALDCDYSLFVKMIGVTGSFAVLGGLMVYLLYLSRKLRKKAVANEVPDTEMFRIIQEEGYFPHKENDGDITFNVKGMVFAFGKCANGFVYGRLYYRMDPDDKWLAMQAAQYTEVSFVAIKVLVIPHRETILFSVESLCNDSESFRAFIHRAVSILAESTTRYHAKLRELKADSDCDECEDANGDRDGDISTLLKMFPRKMMPS